MTDLAKNKTQKRPEPAYEADDGPLTEEFLEFLRQKAAEKCSKGKVISTVTLFDIDFEKLKQ